MSKGPLVTRTELRKRREAEERSRTSSAGRAEAGGKSV